MFGLTREFWLENKASVMVVLASTLMLASVVFLPSFNKLLTNNIPDDAFYYFQIARNISDGEGSTFDGVNMTNGYHPLWMLILIPIFSIFSEGGVYDLSPIYASLSVSILLQFGIGLILVAIFSRFTKSNIVKVLGLLLWFLNPYVIYEGLNGLETSLSIFLLALFILSLMRVNEALSTKRLVFAGIIGGLLILSRLDMIFYVTLGILWLVVFALRRFNFWKNIFPVFVAPIIIILLPWFVWNYLQFGMVLTNSSITSTMVNHALVYQDNGFGVFQTIKASIYTLHNSFRDIIRQTGAPEMSLLLLGFASAIAFIEARKRNVILTLNSFVKSISLPWYLFAGFILQVIANSGIRWTTRSWYFVAANIFFCLVAVWLFECLRKNYSLKKITIIVLSLLFVFSFGVSFIKDLNGRNSAQAEMYASTLWMNDNLPNGSKVGVFNAGVQGYFSKHRVTNLDGLVNGEASKAMQEKRLWQYIKDSKIQYVSDFPLYMDYRYKQFLGINDPFDRLTLIHNINIGAHSRSQSGINIYSVK